MKWHIPHPPKYDRSKKWRQNDSCGEEKSYMVAAQVLLKLFGVVSMPQEFEICVAKDKGLETRRRFSGLSFLFDHKFEQIL